MAKQYKLDGSTRNLAANAVRQTGNLPGVLYGHGISSKPVQVNIKNFVKTFTEAGYSSLIQLTLDDSDTHAVLVREIQLHPVKGNVTHVDFYQVNMNEEIQANVPLEFVGEAPAVKDLGGVLIRSIDELEVEALPLDLPHDIEVDISVLADFDTVIRVGDITLPKGVKTNHEAEEVIALVQAPRSEKEIEELSEEVKEDVEAVEGVAKPEAEEGEKAEGDEEKKD